MDFNLGAYVHCSICGRRFYTEDGYTICSNDCDREKERIEGEEERRYRKVQFCEMLNDEIGVYPEDTDFDRMQDEELDDCALVLAMRDKEINRGRK